MVISFDLDDTLFSTSTSFELEPLFSFLKLFGFEPLRKGAPQLIKTLVAEGHDIAIYTTSLRSPLKIYWNFKIYGIRLNQIINDKLNRKILNKHNCSASKNAKLFNIDLHIDDLMGVKIEGMQFGFNTIIISPEDRNWTLKIREKIKRHK